MIQFTEHSSGRIIGTLDVDSLVGSNPGIDSVVDAKRRMGWDDEAIREFYRSWSNGYIVSKEI